MNGQAIAPGRLVEPVAWDEGCAADQCFSSRRACSRIPRHASKGADPKTHRGREIAWLLICEAWVRAFQRIRTARPSATPTSARDSVSATARESRQERGSVLDHQRFNFQSQARRTTKVETGRSSAARDLEYRATHRLLERDGSDRRKSSTGWAALTMEGRTANEFGESWLLDSPVPQRAILNTGGRRERAGQLAERALAAAHANRPRPRRSGVVAQRGR